MSGADEVLFATCACLISFLVQRAVRFIPRLWTSSTLLRELGAPQLSARLELVFHPRRCRMPESRSSLVAVVRLVIVCFVCCGMGWVLRGCVSGGDAVVFATCACLMPCSANSGTSSVVDIFNVRAGTWSTAALSQARTGLSSTSLPDAGVAIFAGGFCTFCDCLFCVLRDGYGCEGGA